MLVGAGRRSLGREVLVGLDDVDEVVGLDLAGVGADALRADGRLGELVGNFVAHCCDGRAKAPRDRRGCRRLRRHPVATLAAVAMHLGEAQPPRDHLGRLSEHGEHLAAVNKPGSQEGRR